jgi:hypothetical protein
MEMGYRIKKEETIGMSVCVRDECVCVSGRGAYVMERAVGRWG